MLSVIVERPDAFDILRTREIAEEIKAINKQFVSSSQGYVLLGFGRWGTSIDSLGVPIKWSDISAAKVIAEVSIPSLRIDPSQGTHFFQNLTSFHVGYIHVDSLCLAEDVCDWTSLEQMPAIQETAFVRHVRFEHPLTICVDGRQSRALITT